MQRSAIETSTAPAIAQELARAFDTYCAKDDRVKTSNAMVTRHGIFLCRAPVNGGD